MRTTLDVEDDVLSAAKELAAAQGKTAGQVVSELLRRALAPPRATARMRNGVPLLPRRAAGSPVPTQALVNEIRDAS